jgi:uncharacterized membrane protein
MKSRVLVARHALHPMLVVFPLGLLATSVAWDICYLATGNPRWGMISFWTIVAGVVGALLAAVPGFIDWLAIPRGTRARTIGLYHMVLNLAVLGLFVVSLLARSGASRSYEYAGAGRMVWGWIGVAIALVSAWLGGELIETLGISVHEGANADAPSSLTESRATGARGRKIPVHREA